MSVSSLGARTLSGLGRLRFERLYEMDGCKSLSHAYFTLH
jgi:hypothetical protein